MQQHLNILFDGLKKAIQLLSENDLKQCKKTLEELQMYVVGMTVVYESEA